MPLLLPNLDDRTWADLVTEATSLIPVYGPEWTDQNYSDPGITLVELIASIAEMDIYQLNQVSDRERLKFLALAGVYPRPPRPAHAILSLPLAAAIAPVTVPAGLQFDGSDPFGVATRFRIPHSLTLGQGSVSALQSQDAQGYHDLTPQWTRGAVLSPFGADPQPGMIFYVGLTDALPPSQTIQLFFSFADGFSGIEERERVIRHAEGIENHCNPVRSNLCCKTSANIPENPHGDATAEKIPPHHGVRTVWQYAADAAGLLEWISLDFSQKQVADDTRAFTLDGAVRFTIPGAMGSFRVGSVATPNYYLRCVVEAGSYDAAPLIRSIAFNGVLAEQSTPLGSALAIDPGTKIAYHKGPLVPNTLTSLSVQFDSQGRVVSLDLGGGKPGDPQFRVLSFNAPKGLSAGTLSIEALFLAMGNGFPNQHVTVPDAPVIASSFRLYTLDHGAWQAWELRQDFFASQRTDRHAVLNATTGAITFGNGERGQAPAAGAGIFAVAGSTRAKSGNVAADSITALSDTAHNRAILFGTAVPDGWSKLKHELAPASNPDAAWGGASAETVYQAAGRADLLVESSGRAVTLADYERLAADTPGVRVARVKAIANMHPGFPCFKAPGVVTVVVLPYLPQGKPMPTRGLLGSVAGYLSSRRVIGTRVEVVGPTYLEVAVEATAQSTTGTNKANLEQAIVAALNDFLDPLTGGPDGTGWPFGRDVFRAEIMNVINSVSGVDYIPSLTLVAGEGQPQCGNVCLGRTWLVEAGAHQITVL